MMEKGGKVFKSSLKSSMDPARMITPITQPSPKSTRKVQFDPKGLRFLISSCFVPPEVPNFIVLSSVFVLVPRDSKYTFA